LIRTCPRISSWLKPPRGLHKQTARRARSSAPGNTTLQIAPLSTRRRLPRTRFKSTLRHDRVAGSPTGAHDYSARLWRSLFLGVFCAVPCPVAQCRWAWRTCAPREFNELPDYRGHSRVGQWTVCGGGGGGTPGGTGHKPLTISQTANAAQTARRKPASHILARLSLASLRLSKYSVFGASVGARGASGGGSAASR
jgi:hypothetical protein